MGAALGLPGGGSPGAYPHSICTSINSPDCTVTGTADAWALNFVRKLLQKKHMYTDIAHVSYSRSR